MGLQECCCQQELVVVELLEQAYARIKMVNPNARVGLLQGKHVLDPALYDVVVASVPTLGRAGSTRLEGFDRTHFKCIIIDEAHHATAATYLRILDHFGAREPVCVMCT